MSTEACCFPDGSCQELTPDDCTAMGGRTELSFGFGCPAVNCNITCCLPDASCMELSENDCAAMGGTIEPENNGCVLLACCLPDGSCVDTSIECCVGEGGSPQIGVTCASVDCSDSGACCLLTGGCVNVNSIVDCIATGEYFPGSFFAGITCAVATCPEEEACCFADGSCLDLIPQNCVVQSGIPSGGSFSDLCDIVDCEPFGGCCLEDGSCVEATFSGCLFTLDGVYVGDGILCAATDCTQIRACCRPTGTCSLEFPNACINIGGIPQAFGTTCDDVTCLEFEACCFPDGSCIDTNPSDCLNDGGVRIGPGNTCATITCPTIEACCLPDGTCQNLSVADCLVQGVSLGPNTDCATEVCDPPEACCLPDGSCVDIEPLNCIKNNGVTLGPTTTCSPLGACCLPDITCVDTIEICCLDAGGNFLGPGTTCAPIEACCLPDGSCVNTSIVCCQNENGTTLGPGTDCNVDECVRGCCLPGFLCQNLTPTECLNQGGLSLQPGIFCGIIGACCAPDGTCFITDENCCALIGGSHQGAIDCASINDCDAPGVCCFSNGSCLDINNFDQCFGLGGIYVAGQNCANFTCPAPEACCFPDGSCQDLLVAECVLQGSVPQGPGTICATTVCPSIPGACCLPNGICTIETIQDCVNQGGRFVGHEVPCTNPTIVCPANIELSTDPDRCDALFTLPEIMVDDECDDNLVPMCVRDDLLSLLLPYPLGDTEITCIVINISGQSAQCDFTITVVDNQPPVIVSCPEEIAVPFERIEAEDYPDLPQEPEEYCVAFVNPDGLVDLVINENCPDFTITTELFCESTSQPGVRFPCPTIIITNGLICGFFIPGVPLSCPVAIISNIPEHDLGTNMVAVTTVTDINGNTDVCETRIVGADVNPPIIFAPSTIDLSDDCFVDFPSLITVTDDCSDTTLTCVRSDGREIDEPYTFGTVTIVCTATDEAGNQSMSTTVVNVTFVDDVPPTITCPANIVVDNDEGKCGAIVNYPDPISEDRCDFFPTINCIPPSGSFFPVGTTTVSCFTYDVSGNMSSCCFTITVNDVEPPTISCPSDITVVADSGECAKIVGWSVPFACDNCSCTDVVCDPPSGSSFSVGTHQVVCTATDDSGNQSQCTFTVRVIDPDLPIIICPVDITVDNDLDECGAIVTWDPPVANDICTPVEVVCQPPSGSFFPVGTHRVKCTATDVEGNVGECGFCITVIDTEPVILDCPVNVIVEVESDVEETDVIVDKPTVINGVCNIISVVNDYNNTDDASDIYPVGTTSVVWTITDVVGNVTHCKQYIKVLQLDRLDCGVLQNPGDSLENRLSNIETSITDTLDQATGGRTIYRGLPIVEGDMLVSNKKIRGVEKPTCSTDLANKQYVDEQIDTMLGSVRNRINKLFEKYLNN